MYMYIFGTAEIILKTMLSVHSDGTWNDL